MPLIIAECALSEEGLTPLSKGAARLYMIYCRKIQVKVLPADDTGDVSLPWRSSNFTALHWLFGADSMVRSNYYWNTLS